MANNTKVFSSKHENLIASILGGNVVPGSGARPVTPGDVKADEWLAECKTHETPGHTIFFDINVWKKICDEAMAVHRKPVLIVDDGSQKEEFNWCLCRMINIEQANYLTVDFPFAIKKNISAKHDKLKQFLEDKTKRYIGEFFQGGFYSVDWAGEKLAIIPLSLFKEVIK